MISESLRWERMWTHPFASPYPPRERHVEAKKNLTIHKMLFEILGPRATFFQVDVNAGKRKLKVVFCQ